MINITKSWDSGFFGVSLLLLVSIPFGYFFSSLTFVIWAIYSFVWIIKEKKFKLNKLALPLLFFSVLFFISLLWSQDLSSTLHGIGRQLPLFVFALVGVFLPEISEQKFRLMLKKYAVLLCVLGVILFLMAILKYQKYQYRNFLFYHDLVSPLNLNAIYVSYIISSIFLFKLNTLRKGIKDLTIVSFLFIFLVFLSSKTILFTTILTSLGIIFFRIKSKFLKALSFLVVVLLTLSALVFVKPLQNRFTSEFDTSYIEIFKNESFKKGRVYTGLEARLLQIRVFKEIVNKPFEYVFGVGLDASEKEIEVIHKRLNTPEVFQSYNFHNQYIQVLTELGLIGFILFVLVLIILVKKSAYFNFVFPFTVITIALFFTESVLWRQRGIMFFGLMYILIMSINNCNEGKQQISKI